MHWVPHVLFLFPGNGHGTFIFLSYTGPGAPTFLTQEVRHVRIPSLLTPFPATILFPTCITQCPALCSLHLSLPPLHSSLLFSRQILWNPSQTMSPRCSKLSRLAIKSKPNELPLYTQGHGDHQKDRHHTCWSGCGGVGIFRHFHGCKGNSCFGASSGKSSKQSTFWFFLTSASYLGVEFLAGFCSETPPQQTQGFFDSKIKLLSGK